MMQIFNTTRLPIINVYSSFLLLLICLSLVSCKEITQEPQLLQSNDIHISFKQNGKVIKPENNSILLDKQPFEIQFSYTNQNFILVNASFENYLISKALKGENLTDANRFTSGHILAESFYNPERSIYVTSEASSAWLQESKEYHMFDKLELKNGTSLGTRTIENIFDLDENQNIEIQFIDKPLFLVFLVVTSDQQELQRISFTIDWNQDNNASIKEKLLSRFNSLFKSSPVLELPLIEKTNFDNLVTGKYLTKQELNTLQLGKVYPNLYTAGYHYKSSISYGLDISLDFKSLAITTQKGDHELETVLINYDLKGKYIDHKVISYDEIADGSNTVQSQIDTNHIITKTSIHYADYLEEPEFYKIEDDGTIKTIYLNEVILAKLDIAPNDVYKDLTSIEEISNSKTLILYAVIHKQTEDQIDLDAYVVIVNPLNGEIESQYKEENRWTIDAIKIIAIEVAYNPFKINEDSETVGIKVYHQLDIPIKFYLSNEYNLYERNGATFKELLRDYEVGSYHEDIDDNGSSKILEISKHLQPIEDSLKSYYDLKIVKEELEKTNVNGREQDSVKQSSIEYLKYINGQYMPSSEY